MQAKAEYANANAIGWGSSRRLHDRVLIFWDALRELYQRMLSEETTRPV
jgi:hypothetical protein